MGNMKKNGTKDFSIIDAFTSVKNSMQYVECNYCGHLSKDNEDALNHFDSVHSDIRDKNFPQKKLDEKTGKCWLVPKEETIEHSIFAINAVDYYIHFYGFCMYDSVALTPEEKKLLYLDQKTSLWKFDRHSSSLQNLAKPIYTKKRKKKYVYSYNVGQAKIEDLKKKLKEAHKIGDDDIIIKPNKKGNFAVFYYR